MKPLEFLRQCDLRAVNAELEEEEDNRSCGHGLIFFFSLPLLVLFVITTIVPVCKPIAFCCLCTTDKTPNNSWIYQALEKECVSSSSCQRQMSDKLHSICSGNSDIGSDGFELDIYTIGCPGLSPGDRCNKQCNSISTLWQTSLNYSSLVNIQQSQSHCAKHTGICDALSRTESGYGPSYPICRYPETVEVLTRLGAGIALILGVIVVSEKTTIFLQRLRKIHKEKRNGSWTDFLLGCLCVLVFNYFGVAYLTLAPKLSKRLRGGGQLTFSLVVMFCSSLLFVLCAQTFGFENNNIIIGKDEGNTGIVVFFVPLFVTLLFRFIFGWLLAFRSIYTLVCLKAKVSAKLRPTTPTPSLGEGRRRPESVGHESNSQVLGDKNSPFDPRKRDASTSSFPEEVEPYTIVSTSHVNKTRLHTRWPPFMLGLFTNIVGLLPVRRLQILRSRPGYLHGSIINTLIIGFTGIWVGFYFLDLWPRFSFRFPLQLPSDAWIIAAYQGLFSTMCMLITVGILFFFSAFVWNLPVRSWLLPSAGAGRITFANRRPGTIDLRGTEQKFLFGLVIPLCTFFIATIAFLIYFIVYFYVISPPNATKCDGVIYWPMIVWLTLVSVTGLYCFWDQTERFRFGSKLATGLSFVIVGDLLWLLGVGYCSGRAFTVAGNSFAASMYHFVGGSAVMYAILRARRFRLSVPSLFSPSQPPHRVPHPPASRFTELNTGSRRFSVPFDSQNQNKKKPDEVNTSFWLWDKDDSDDSEEDSGVSTSVESSKRTSSYFSFSSLTPVKPGVTSPSANPHSSTGRGSEVAQNRRNSVGRNSDVSTFSTRVNSGTRSHDSFTTPKHTTTGRYSDTQYVSFEYSPLLADVPSAQL